MGCAYLCSGVDFSGVAVSTAIHVTGNLRALWFFLIPALFGVSYHDGDEGEKK